VTKQAKFQVGFTACYDYVNIVLRLGLEMAGGCARTDGGDGWANVWVVGCRREWQTAGQLAVPWLRRLVAGLSTRRPGFDHVSVHVECVMCRVAQGLVSFATVGFPPVSVIPPLLHTHSSIDAV